MSAVEFRKTVYDYVTQNADNLFQTLSFSSSDKRITYISEIQNRVYQSWMKNEHIGKEYWMETSTIFPILANMYPHLEFVVYDLEQCTTSICCFSKNKNYSIWQMYHYTKIVSKNSVILLYDGYDHFDLLLKKPTMSL